MNSLLTYHKTYDILPTKGCSAKTDKVSAARKARFANGGVTQVHRKKGATRNVNIQAVATFRFPV